MTSQLKQPCSCGERNVCGMEVRGVYDGVLYWFCLSCGVAWQRWDKKDRLHAVAAPYIAADNLRVEQSA